MNLSQLNLSNDLPRLAMLAAGRSQERNSLTLNTFETEINLKFDALLTNKHFILCFLATANLRIQGYRV